MVAPACKLIAVFVAVELVFGIFLRASAARMCLRYLAFNCVLGVLMVADSLQCPPQQLHYSDSGRLSDARARWQKESPASMTYFRATWRKEILRFGELHRT